MRIDQRNAGASVTQTTSPVYTVDRWYIFGQANASKFTAQQNAGSVTPPTGFTNYQGITSSSSYSIGSSDQYYMLQRIEGYNIADLNWGTANAQSVTLSFWVRSSLTGTFGASISNNTNYWYPFTYTISSANTWTYITVTIPAPTSGTWLSTNGIGAQVIFGLGVGSTLSGPAGSWSSSTYLSATGATSVVGTNGATWYITGVQLEAGSNASGFEFLPIDVSLGRCQRYFQLVNTICGNATTPTIADMQVAPISNLRTSPTVSQNGVLNVYDDQVGGFTQSSTSISTIGTFNQRGGIVRLGNFSGMTTNRFLLTSSSVNSITLDAEL
jgi:hypothetical protein